MNKRTIKDVERELYISEFNVKRCQYNDHLYDMEKFTLNDLPLVWKNKTSVIDSNPHIDETEMLEYRLKVIFDMVYTSPYYEIDKEVEEKILNEYLKNFNYKIDA